MWSVKVLEHVTFFGHVKYTSLSSIFSFSEYYAHGLLINTMMDWMVVYVICSKIIKYKVADGVFILPALVVDDYGERTEYPVQYTLILDI